MQPATAGNVAAHNSPAGRKKMSTAEILLFMTILYALIIAVMVASDDDDFLT
jgi:hypothetical protein